MRFPQKVARDIPLALSSDSSHNWSLTSSEKVEQVDLWSILSEIGAKSGMFGHAQAPQGVWTRILDMGWLPFMDLYYHTKNHPNRSSGSWDIQLSRIERSDWPMKNQVSVNNSRTIRPGGKSYPWPESLHGPLLSCKKLAQMDQPFLRYLTFKNPAIWLAESLFLNILRTRVFPDMRFFAKGQARCPLSFSTVFSQK